MSRHQAREKALQILYQQLVRPANGEQTAAQFGSEFQLGEADVTFTQELLDGVKANLTTIDATIEKYSHHWKVERIAPIDLILLRMGIFELLFAKETPAAVVINEAVELSKRFGGDETSGFVHGILDAIQSGEES